MNKGQRSGVYLFTIVQVSNCRLRFFPLRFLEWEFFLVAAFYDHCLLVPFHDLCQSSLERLSKVHNINKHTIIFEDH